MNHTDYRRDIWTFWDDILCDVQQLSRWCIHVADGCLWTLTRIGRNLGNRSCYHKYRIHRLMNGGWKVWTRKKSRQNSASRESDYVDHLYDFSCYLFYLARWNWVFWLYDALSDSRISRTNYYAKGCPPRTPVKSFWIWAIDGKYRFPTYRFYDWATHTIPRYPLACKSSWK